MRSHGILFTCDGPTGSMDSYSFRGWINGWMMDEWMGEWMDG